MYDFLRYVLYELRSILLVVMLALIPAAGVLAAIYIRHRKRYGKELPFPWGRVILYFLLAGYLFVLFCVTLLRRMDGWREISFHPFRAWREAWNDFSFKSWANVLLNVGLFVPAGFLMPVLWEKMRKWYRTVPAALGLSLIVELVQLALARGVCDIDDLIANTLGGILGFFLAMALLGLKNKERLFRYTGLVLGTLAVLALPFGLYGLKTYGNLPQAPAYRLNTAETQWILDCTLPLVPDTAPVYRTQTLRRADCDEIARLLTDLSGSEIGVTSFYQEMAYYNLDNGILKVYYHDGSWEYLSSHHWDLVFDSSEEEEIQWPLWDRKQVEAALEPYPVRIPEKAIFTSEEEGWYCFSCDALVDGDSFWDGDLRCRFTPDGAVSEIQAGLIPFTYHSDASVLSGEAAWERLQKGWFRDDLGYSRRTPDTVSTSSCTFGYTVDTKGFYQPVWRFTLTGNNGFSGEVLIPALQ